MAWEDNPARKARQLKKMATKDARAARTLEMLNLHGAEVLHVVDAETPAETPADASRGGVGDNSAPRLAVGVLGTANIARKNIIALHASENTTPACVGSRSLSRAEEFAVETKLQRGYGSYAEVLEEGSGCGAVYIPLPTALHAEWVARAAAASARPHL